MEAPENYIQALIQLHLGLERLGPGDDAFSKHMLSLLPELPENPRIVDIGCGTGAGTLLLAENFRTKIRAVDFARGFLDELKMRARQKGLEGFVETIECDMGSLNWDAESVDLLWSEGAAYSITLERALKSWRPFMAPAGIAVISEMNYFIDDIPPPVREYMQTAYPTVGTEPENSACAIASGYEVLGIHRLPSHLWWDNYYGPLKDRMTALQQSTDEMMQSVILETEAEMDLFEKYDELYGYSFYVLRAV